MIGNPPIPDKTAPAIAATIPDNPTHSPISKTIEQPIKLSEVDKDLDKPKGIVSPQSLVQETTFPSLSSAPNRHKFITLAALGGMGFVGAIIWGSTQSKSSKIKPIQGSPSLNAFNFKTVTVNARGEIASRSNKQAESFVETWKNGITLEMVSIPGGKFTMGSPATEKEQKDSQPQHEVSIKPFFMGKFEVTQAQWQAVMGNNPSRFKGDKRPVEHVLYQEAKEFCKKLSLETLMPYRLPSEAEWEYACRAGTTTPFYFGETITPALVNYNGNDPYGAVPKGEYRQSTTDVGSFPANAFGLYEMHGNVWEWCQDEFHENYNGAPVDGSAWEAKGNENEILHFRILRGGSFDEPARSSCSAIRFPLVEANKSNSSGFRVVVSVR